MSTPSYDAYRTEQLLHLIARLLLAWLWYQATQDTDQMRRTLTALENEL